MTRFANETDEKVRAWYRDPARWKAHGKDASWIDRVLVDQGELLRNKDVLNLGCFYPEDEQAFMGIVNSWTAIDFTPEVIAWCKSWVGWPAWVKFEVEDMRELSYGNESFDVVLDFSSGDHLMLGDMKRMLKEAWRVLRPGGRFVLVFTEREASARLDPYWKEHSFRVGTFGFERVDTWNEMTVMVEQAGFHVFLTSDDPKTERRVGLLAVKPADAVTPPRPARPEPRPVPSMGEVWPVYLKLQTEMAYGRGTSGPSQNTKETHRMANAQLRGIAKSGPTLFVGPGGTYETDAIELPGPHHVLTAHEPERNAFPSATSVTIGDMHRLPYPSGKFGCLWSCNVLEHALSPYVALLEARRVLQDEGLAYFVLPSFSGTQGGTGPFHLHCLDGAVWRELLRKTGFHIRGHETQTNHDRELAYYEHFVCRAAEVPEPHRKVLEAIEKLTG
jgi:SAM-dependent methyltransferase